MSLLVAVKSRNHLATRAVRAMTLRPIQLRSLALCRIGLGVGIVSVYVSNIGYREFLWGPEGYAGGPVAHHAAIPLLYEVSRSTAWFNLVFFSGLAVSLLWTILGGRVLTIPTAVFEWSLQMANGNICDGGDNLVRIILIAMCFTCTNAYFSPLSRKVRERVEPPREVSFANSVHNASTLLIIFEVCTVYVVAGAWKIVGERWRSGDAVYYVTRTLQFSYSNVLAFAMTNPYIVTIATYVTVVAEISVLPAVITRRRWFREAVMTTIALMHVNIIFGMGLFSFGFIMLGADAMIIRDSDHARFGTLLRSVRREASQVFSVRLHRSEDQLLPDNLSAHPR